MGRQRPRSLTADEACGKVCTHGSCKPNFFQCKLFPSDQVPKTNIAFQTSPWMAPNSTRNGDGKECVNYPWGHV